MEMLVFLLIHLFGMSLLWAMGTVEVQLDVHAQNVMALEKILKDVKSDARKLQSKQVEFYLSVC